MSRLEYKGYWTDIEYSPADKVLHGKIEGINDLVNFESESAIEIEQEFHSAVDDYLAFCKEIGKEPDKAYKGCFNIRISPELHKRVAEFSYMHAITLNECIGRAIKQYLEDVSIFSAITSKGFERILAYQTPNYNVDEDGMSHSWLCDEAVNLVLKQN